MLIKLFEIFTLLMLGTHGCEEPVLALAMQIPPPCNIIIVDGTTGKVLTERGIIK